MKSIFINAITLIACLYPLLGFTQGEPLPPKNIVVTEELGGLLDNQDYNRRNISITDASGGVSYKSLRDIDEELENGARLYRTGDYEKAYTVIGELAQWGVKEAQSILGGMFMKGEHVDKSIERGLAWLGVAKEGGTVKSASKSFDYVYSQLNDQQRMHIDKVVVSYIEKFGSDAQNFRCKSRRVPGSNIPKKSCIKVLASNSILYPIE